MYNVEITHKQDLAFEVKTARSELIVDAQGQGVGPLEALLAGLGTCIGVYICKYAQGSKLDFNNFKIKVSASLTHQAPFSFSLISVQIDLKGYNLDDRRKRALLEFIKNCPAHNTLKGSPVIEFKLSEN